MKHIWTTISTILGTEMAFPLQLKDL